MSTSEAPCTTSKLAVGSVTNELSERGKFIVLIDMDMVLFDWFSAVKTKLEESRPDLASQLDLTTTGTFNLALKFEENADREAVYNAAASLGLYANLPLIDGAAEVMEWLQTEEARAGISPYIVTSPNLHCPEQSCWSEKAQSVEKNFGKWWLHRLVITRDKTIVRGDVLIDDKPSIEGSIEPTWTQWVFEQPWNASCEANSVDLRGRPIKMINNWVEGLKSLKGLLEHAPAVKIGAWK